MDANNVWIGNGNLGKDAEIVEVGENKICKFSIAVSKKGFTTKNGRTIQDKTTWVQIEKWNVGGLAQYLQKGVRVAVIGELDIREHEGKYYTSIQATSIQLLSTKQDSRPSQTTTSHPTGLPSSPPPQLDEGDGLPF